MKAIHKSLAAIAFAASMAGPVAAQTFPTAPPGSFTGIFFDNVEYCIGCQDGLINVGDQFVITKIVAPKNLDDDDKATIEKLQRKHPLNPRTGPPWS